MNALPSSYLRSRFESPYRPRMDRRRFLLTSLAGAFAVLDLPSVATASAQTSVKVPTIGYLSRRFPGAPGAAVDAFITDLHVLLPTWQ